MYYIRLSNAEILVLVNSMSQEKKVNILVTGGAGFIGSNLVDALLRDSRVELVRVLDDFSNGRRKNLNHWLKDSRLEILEGDIRDFSVCQQACKNIDKISHQAAMGSVPRSIKDPLTTHNVNVNGTMHVFTAAKEAGIKKIVYASSSSVYGDSEILPKKEQHTGNLLSPYALSKSIAEQYAALYARNYGMNFTGLRYFNIFGPNQDPGGPYAAVIPLFLKAINEGVAPQIFGDGENSRDFTYVTNAVQANVLGLFKEVTKAEAHVYNIACGYRTTINELWKALSQLSGRDLSPVHLPVREGDIPHSLADISKAKTDLNFVPDTVFLDGLKKTYEWFANEYK
ncbi:MAG: Vi polysaccharide biosynthesis protein VipB/TviC [Cytophagaceae bacterium]|nr:Vi polysaccharide biosynthesis protein VipB/TviC [Cytophagaceae bacterium]